jgi:hypothetical protein
MAKFNCWHFNDLLADSIAVCLKAAGGRRTPGRFARWLRFKVGAALGGGGGEKGFQDLDAGFGQLF